MSIAVDQTRLRRIVENLLTGGSLDRAEATSVLQITQLAAGIEIDAAHHGQRASLQAIAQQLSSLAGGTFGEVLPIPRITDEEAQASWLGSLAAQLKTRGARELAYALAFLVSVVNLEITPDERAALEAFQHALGLDHRRATEIVILLTDTVSTSDPMAANG